MALILLQWKEKQNEEKEILGEEYADYNLVMATAFGMPVGEAVIRSGLKKLIEENDLPPVVMHSLRHTTKKVSHFRDSHPFLFRGQFPGVRTLCINFPDQILQFFFRIFFFLHSITPFPNNISFLPGKFYTVNPVVSP